MINNGVSVDNIAMIACDQLAASMMWLPATGEIFRAVKPEYSQVYMIRVSSTDLKNFGEPVLYGIGCFVYTIVIFLDEYVLAYFELLREF
jgi:hypothetical protein